MSKTCLPSLSIGFCTERKEFDSEEQIVSFYCRLVFRKGLFLYSKANRTSQKLSTFDRMADN